MPGTLLLDSDILIDHLRKEQKALAYLTYEIDAGSLIFISVVSRTEILSGARKGEEQTIHGLFDIVTPIDVDVPIADRAGEYMQKFRKGYSIGIGDALIAATAKEIGGALVTRNIKHYPMKDLKIIQPY
jgi:predicted nucleic acid-binding protein